MQQTKRDELVRKALDTFYRNGFHATGMDMIASETGVSKTSIYKHFRTKEDLILAVLRLRDERSDQQDHWATYFPTETPVLRVRSKCDLPPPPAQEALPEPTEAEKKAAAEAAAQAEEPKAPKADVPKKPKPKS